MNFRIWQMYMFVLRFTAIPGLLSPAPFGGSPRTIEINVDPDLLRSHNMTADQIVEAIRITIRRLLRET